MLIFSRASFLRASILSLVAISLVFAQEPQQQAAYPTLAVTGDIPTPLTLKAEDR